MGRRRKYYSAEQIVTKLRDAEVLLGQGKTIAEARKVLEISEQTYYRWRREYEGMDISRAKKFKELENENKRLNNLVADLSLDNVILKEVLKKNSPDRKRQAVQQVIELLGCFRTTCLSGDRTI